MKQSLANLRNLHARHELEISEREKRAGALKDLTDEARKKAEAEIIARYKAELEGMKLRNEELNGQIAVLQGHLAGEETELSDLKARVAELQGGIARLKTEHDTSGRELSEEHEAKIVALNKANNEEMQKLLKDHVDKLQGINKDHEDKMAGLRQTGAETQAAHDKLVAEIAELKRQNQTLLDGHATETAGLKNTITRLEVEVKLKQGVITKEEAVLEQTGLNNQSLQNLIIQLKDENQNLENAIEKVTLELDEETERTETVVAHQLEKLDKKLDGGMDTQIDVLKLRQLLQAGNYAGFYELIKETAPEKETYTAPALFLMLESIAGTWKMYGEGATDVLVRKLVYDRRLWDTIANAEKNTQTHYNSRHLTGFMHAFGLEAKGAASVALAVQSANATPAAVVQRVNKLAPLPGAPLIQVGQ